MYITAGPVELQSRGMNELLSWLLPLLSSSLSFIFAGLLFYQWHQRRKPYQLVWGVGLVWYGIAAGTEFLGYAFGWSDLLYRAWYQFGAIMVAAYLGAGTVYLLRETRFGYLVALGVLVGALPAIGRGFALVREGDAALAATAFAIGLIGVLAAVLIAMTQQLRPRWVGHVTLAWLVAGSLASLVVVAGARMDTALMFDPATGVIQGRGFPDSVRLLTPLFNIAGGLTLILGAVYSGWQFWRKGTAGHRVVSNALIALGGFIPSLTSSLNRFGFTSAFFLGELLGVLSIFLGFLVSTEVFAHRERGADVAAVSETRRATV